MNKQQSYTWYAVFRVLVFWLLTMVCLALPSGLVKHSRGIYSPVIITMIAIVATLFLTFLFVRWQKMKVADTGIVPGKKTLPKLGIGILIGSALAVLQPLAVFATGHISLIGNTDIPAREILSSLTLYFLLACREELVFRGFILRSIQAVSGPVQAMLVTSLLFIIEHIIGGMNWWPGIWGSGTGALLFGLAALVSRGLALPIGIHFAWNAMQWILGFKNSAGIFRTIITKGHEDQLETIASISYMVVMGLAITAFLYYRKKQTQATLN